jgi:hypothetical protein
MLAKTEHLPHIVPFPGTLWLSVRSVYPKANRSEKIWITFHIGGLINGKVLSYRGT